MAAHTVPVSNESNDAMEVSESPVPESVSSASNASPDEFFAFRQDLSTARKELNQLTKWLNVLILAYNNAHTSSLAKHHTVVDRISLKLLRSLTFYRNTARKLAIHARTTQENQQLASLHPPAEYFKLERLQAELEVLKNSVNKLILQDYSVFSDLKLVPSDELLKIKPDLLPEGFSQSDTDQQHKIFSAQIAYEQERRKKVMNDIEVLTKKKKSLQDEVKRRKDALIQVTKDVDETGKTFLESLAQKLNFSPSDIHRDISDIGGPVLDAFHSLQNREKKSEPPAEADVEMADVPDTPLATPEAVKVESAEEAIAREEGEASDEGETGHSPSHS